MKKNKIFIKFFTMTAGLVLFILVLQFGFQYIKLEGFYTNSKKESVTKSLTLIKDKIEKDGVEKEKIEEYLKQVSIENDIYVGIFNRYGIPQYGINEENVFPYIKIQDNNKETYKVYIDYLVNNKMFIKSLDKNKVINVQGVLEDYNNQKIIYPDSITVDGVEFFQEAIPIEMESGITMIDGEQELSFPDEDTSLNYDEIGVSFESEQINLQSTITDINLTAVEDYSMEYRKEELLDEVFLFLGSQKNLNTVIDSNKMIQYSRENPLTGIKNMVFIQPVLIEKKEPMFIFALSSLQLIEETTKIMKGYFLVILLMAIVMAIIISYFYSKKITTPLLHLNDVTKSMTNLDFSKKCEVYSNDEIGDLGENINTMSKKLKKTLDEVKRSNEKLKEDIVFREKMDQFRKRFIADASHELKTPLTVMRGVCEGVRDGIYDGNNSENYEIILNEINDMSKLVYDLLESSKLESSEVSFKTSIFQLSDVVLKTHSKLKKLIENKNLKVSLELSEDFVLGDEDKIERVIGNLYYNAIQYTSEKGKINININREGDECYFIIENSPANISKDDLTKIWEPFYRGEKSRNKALGGSGLGLYMAKTIFENHNSEYGIKNTSTGVRVYFSLHRIEEE